MDPARFYRDHLLCMNGKWLYLQTLNITKRVFIKDLLNARNCAGLGSLISKPNAIPPLSTALPDLPCFITLYIYSAYIVITESCQKLFFLPDWKLHEGWDPSYFAHCCIRLGNGNPPTPSSFPHSLPPGMLICLICFQGPMGTGSLYI